MYIYPRVSAFICGSRYLPISYLMNLFLFPGNLRFRGLDDVLHAETVLVEEVLLCRDFAEFVRNAQALHLHRALFGQYFADGACPARR